MKGLIQKKESFVRDIKQGSIFGEVALLNGTRRTASVRSKDYCTVGALNEENFNELIRYFPEIRNRFKETVRKYHDHWKDYQIQMLGEIDYFKKLHYEAKEEMHYLLKQENFETGAKVFSRGTECTNIYIIVSGEIELYVEQSSKEYKLDVLRPGSIIGTYSVINEN